MRWWKKEVCAAVFLFAIPRRSCIGITYASGTPASRSSIPVAVQITQVVHQENEDANFSFSQVY